MFCKGKLVFIETTTLRKGALHILFFKVKDWSSESKSLR